LHTEVHQLVCKIQTINSVHLSFQLHFISWKKIL